MRHPDHERIERVVVEGDVEGAARLAQAVVAGGEDLLAAVESFSSGIRRVGELWQEGEYFLPELVQGAEAMKAAMAILEPALGGRRGARKPRGTVVIGTVEGDLHDIGKSLVATLLVANGFEVHDLGSNVPVAAFLEKAREVDADIVAASALLTTTMTVQRELAARVRATGSAGRPRVLVGGAPTSEAWARAIGAAHAESAMRAVAVAERLVDSED